jgi:thioredoxin reductase (NADPH)
VVEPIALGGQAASSSMIRNYVGFAHGISGSELMARAAQQAWLFRASFIFGKAAMNLRENGELRVVCFDDGSELCGRAVILATGVDYRRIGVSSLEALIGRGVFYGSAVSEAPSMSGGQVYIVGGANSAGQSALFLARYAARVTIAVRSTTLADSMSDYLIQQIAATPNVTVRFGTTVVDGRGDHRLRSITLMDAATGATEEVEAAGLFILIGAAPRTDWLPSEIRRDDKGYILTGGDADTFTGDGGRRSAALETSLSGVFAVGDVRSGSVKRVSSAVGDGSIAIRQIHEYLAAHGGVAYAAGPHAAESPAARGSSSHS